MDLTLEAYLTALSGFREDDISSGCAKAMRSGGAFPPSSAELCQLVAGSAESRIRSEAYANDRRSPQPRLAPPPRHDYTDAELADFALDINVRGAQYVMREINGSPLTIPPGYPGAGKPTFHGYVTPSEARTYPRSLSWSTKPPPRGSMQAEQAEYERALAAGETPDFTKVELPPLSPRLRAHFGLDGDR